MKERFVKLLASTLALSMILAGCGNTKIEGSDKETTPTESTKEANNKNSGEEIKDLVIYKLTNQELSTFNILNSQGSSDFQNLVHVTDGLLEANKEGKLSPAIAEEWGTEDGGLTWTFKLRDGVKWVDIDGKEKADCLAQDFATGLEWVLNFHKNESANTSMPIEMIQGAKEYYEYTKSLSPQETYALTAEEGSKFRETVGIEVVDDHTLVYHCTSAKPYFDSLAAYVALYPISQQLIDELGVDGIKSMNNENMWYNGCYTMTSYVQGNEKIFTKNPLYWDTECKRFDTVTFKMVESNDIAFQLYDTGELDYVQLGEAQVNTIAKDPENKYHNYLVPDVRSHMSYHIHFDFNKNNEDGTPDTNWNTAAANEAFRKSWYYGLDLTNYWKRTNAVDPMSCENNFYTMKGLIYTSDGTDYVELVRKELGMPEENGETPVRLDAEKAEEYKQQAIEELSAMGVTFPIEADYYIVGSDQAALDSANVLSQIFSDCLGDDYVKLNIKTYIKASRSEVLTPHLHSFAISGWGADYADPQNYLGQEMYGYDNAYFSSGYSYINEVVEETPENKALLDTYKEYTKMVEEADSITEDLDARYEAYAKAEAYLLDHALVVPCNYKVLWVLSKIDNDSKINTMFGCQNSKMKNWDTNINGYTSEEKGVSEQIAAFVESK